MRVEVWRDIPGYEGRYQVSTRGRVKRLKRATLCISARTGSEYIRIVPESLLKPRRYVKNGCIAVKFDYDISEWPVYYLVLLTFTGEKPEGRQVVYKDGNVNNNTLENLSYERKAE